VICTMGMEILLSKFITFETLTMLETPSLKRRNNLSDVYLYTLFASILLGFL